jgi:hypothetical protein
MYVRSITALRIDAACELLLMKRDTLSIIIICFTRHYKKLFSESQSFQATLPEL